MKKFTSILQKNSIERAADAVTTSEEFKSYAHNRLSTNETYDHEVADQLIESLLTENKNDVKLSLEGLNDFVQSVESIDEGRHDSIELTPKTFFVAFDNISVLDALYDLWLEYNSETWYSAHIGKAIDKIKAYVDQYASHVSAYHHRYRSAKLNISDAEALLKNKQFASVVKRSVEWKELKKFLTTFDVEQATGPEAPTGEAIVKAAFKEIDKLISIVSSK